MPDVPDTKIAVFLPNWIGDVVMATPTLRALRRLYGPNARIVGLMKPYVTEVLSGTSLLDEIWHYDRESVEAGLRWPAVTWRMFRFRFDVVVLLVNTRRQAVIAWLARAKKRAGYVRCGRGFFLTHRLYPPRKEKEYTPVSALDYYLQIAYALGAGETAPDMELATTQADENRANLVSTRLGLRSDGRTVLLNSSGAYGAAKLWPDSSFAALGYRIASELDHDVLVVCGPEECQRARQISQEANHERVFSLDEEDVSIGLTKALVRRSRLLVTTDSGPRHFAPAFGVPVVSLFGPTDPAWSDTHYSAETRLHVPLECRPCGERVCPLEHHRCMNELSVSLVFRSVRDRLNARDRGNPVSAPKACS